MKIEIDVEGKISQLKLISEKADVLRQLDRAITQGHATYDIVQLMLHVGMDPAETKVMATALLHKAAAEFKTHLDELGIPNEIEVV